MRYFKYKNTDKNINNALKEQYKTLTKDEQRTVRKEKTWRKFSESVAIFIFLLIMVVGIYWITLIPSPNGGVLQALVIFGKIFLGVVWFAISGLSAYIVTLPLWKKVESLNLPSMKKEIFSKACRHLRNYYELQEPYIITKCFDSSDENFKNHDVCIFVVRDELRITADLQQGFLHGERDLGCYTFKREEVTLTKKQNGKYLLAELTAGHTVFLLGYRAKGFIEKNFTAKESK